MKTQQAPSGLPSGGRQAVREEPSQFALKTAHSRKGGRVQKTKVNPARLMTVLSQEEKRLCLSQPRAPRSRGGGGRSGAREVATNMIHRSRMAMIRLYQFMSAEMIRLTVR